MHLSREKCFYVYAGRDFASGAGLCVEIGFGYREDAEQGEICFRHYWRWSSARLPHLIFAGRRPIGICAFGRCRIWRHPKDAA